MWPLSRPSRGDVCGLEAHRVREEVRLSNALLVPMCLTVPASCQGPPLDDSPHALHPGRWLPACAEARRRERQESPATPQIEATALDLRIARSYHASGSSKDKVETPKGSEPDGSRPRPPQPRAREDSVVAADRAPPGRIRRPTRRLSIYRSSWKATRCIPYESLVTRATPNCAGGDLRRSDLRGGPKVLLGSRL
jgi:hypothetical protein